ncbi:hypothetical protein ABT160_04470 [Streptomyces sp. NPDC001941]|uniref:hypothetical protein n=1 Tax=Streptomyces sp. NPDC001941 TaxID=3154659 RepID=UPI003332FA4F
MTPVMESVRQQFGPIQIEIYNFYWEYRSHELFRVSVTDRDGSFHYTVRGWEPMIRSVNAFTTSVAHAGMCQRAKEDIFTTGYALVNGCNIRVTPLS